MMFERFVKCDLMFYVPLNAMMSKQFRWWAVMNKLMNTMMDLVIFCADWLIIWLIYVVLFWNRFVIYDAAFDLPIAVIM